MNEQETTTMNEQETTTMNEQETTMNENTNNEQQETTMENEIIINNKSVIDTIITALSGIIVNYEKYNVMQNDVIEMKSVIDSIKNENIKNTMLAELRNMENNAENERKNATKNAQTEIIVYIMEKLDLSCNTKKSNVSRKSNVPREKTVNTDKYTYIDAVCDAVTDDWQTAGPIAKNAEKIGKLAQITTNARWTGSFANALAGAADDGLIERRNTGKYNEYRRLQTAAD